MPAWLLLLGPAQADEPPPAASLSGEWRAIASLPPNFAVDDEGGEVGQGFVLDHRLRLGGQARLGGFTFQAEGDLFTAQLAGDTWALGSEDERRRDAMGALQPHAFDARKAMATRRLGPVQVDVGLMTSHWGLGLLANDGAQDPLFGRADGGDVVLRAMATTRPVEGSPLALALALDRGWHDDIGSWFPGGQAVTQGIVAALYAPPEGLKAGAYAVYRHQLEADRRRDTDLGVVDLYVDAPFEVGGLTLRAAGEAAGIFGRTSRAASVTSPQGLRVRQLGGVALLSAHALEGRAGLLLKGGAASGDGDPYDDLSADFGFDPNLDVGMILFDEVQGALGAAAYGKLADPSHMGQPPDGADVLVSEGALRHAAFVQPVLEARPLPGLTLRLGGVLAWSTAPIADPFMSGRNGGVPTNHLGQPTQGRALGAELDYGVELSRDFAVGPETLTPALRLQGGHYFASEDVGTGRADLFMATARLRW